MAGDSPPPASAGTKICTFWIMKDCLYDLRCTTAKLVCEPFKRVQNDEVWSAAFCFCNGWYCLQLPKGPVQVHAPFSNAQEKSLDKKISNVESTSHDVHTPLARGGVQCVSAF